MLHDTSVVQTVKRNPFLSLVLSTYRASLVAQLVKSLSEMWETWAQSLGWEELLEMGKAARSSILAWRIPWTP